MPDTKKSMLMVACVLAWKKTIDELLASGAELCDILTTGQTVMATLAHDLGCPGGSEFAEYAKSIFDQIAAEIERQDKEKGKVVPDSDKPSQPMMN